MRGFRRKIAAAVAVASLAAQCVFASGWPVLDVANLMSAVQRLYATYESINNTITQIQNTYTQIEQAVNQVKTFDWSNVKDAAKKYANSWSDLSDMSAWEILTNKEKVLATKSSLTNLTREFSNSVNIYTNVYHKLDESTVEINGKKFSPLGLFGVGKHGDGTAISLGMNSIAAAAKNDKEFIDALTKEKTLEEQEAIMRQYGVNRDTAIALECAEAIIDGEGDKIIAMGTEDGQKVKENWDASLRMAETAQQEISSDDESLAGHLETIVTAVDNASASVSNDLQAIKMKNSYDIMRDRQQQAIEKQKAEEKVDKEKNEKEDGNTANSNTVKANMETKPKNK